MNDTQLVLTQDQKADLKYYYENGKTEEYYKLSPPKQHPKHYSRHGFPEFKSWNKISRLSNETVTITEKIDGTNALLCIRDGVLYTGSRNKWITPLDDNAGFSRWAEEHKSDLLQLGEGYHYGEWYGKGIQRGYGLKEKRLALFYLSNKDKILPTCCELVPTLGIYNIKPLKSQEEETFDAIVYSCIYKLKCRGSIAAIGYMKPEGIIVQFHDSGKRYKILCENDDIRKGEIK